MKIKNECLQHIPDLTNKYRWAEKWLKKFKIEWSSDEENRDEGSSVGNAEKPGSERGSPTTKQLAQTEVENTAGAENYLQSGTEHVSEATDANRNTLKEEHEMAWPLATDKTVATSIPAGPEDVARSQLQALKLEETVPFDVHTTETTETNSAEGGSGISEERETTQGPLSDKKSENIEAEAPAVPKVPEFNLANVHPPGDCVDDSGRSCTMS